MVESGHNNSMESLFILSTNCVNRSQGETLGVKIIF